MELEASFTSFSLSIFFPSFFGKVFVPFFIGKVCFCRLRCISLSPSPSCQRTPTSEFQKSPVFLVKLSKYRVSNYKGFRSWLSAFLNVIGDYSAAPTKHGITVALKKVADLQYNGKGRPFCTTQGWRVVGLGKKKKKKKWWRVVLANKHSSRQEINQTISFTVTCNASVYKYIISYYSTNKICHFAYQPHLNRGKKWKPTPPWSIRTRTVRILQKSEKRISCTLSMIQMRRLQWCTRRQDPMPQMTHPVSFHPSTGCNQIDICSSEGRT